MSWNADNTVWTSTPGSVGAGSHQLSGTHTLTHIGNGKWRFTTLDLGSFSFDNGDELEAGVGTAYVNWGNIATVQVTGEISKVLEHTYYGEVNTVTFGVGYIDQGGHSLSPVSLEISIPEVNPDNPYVAPSTGPTHRINVTARNVDHWSWSLDGGPDNMMPAGSTYADITIGESAPAYAVGDVVGISYYRQFNIADNYGGDEDGGDDIDEYTRLYYLPFNMGDEMLQTTGTGYTQYSLLTTRFEYSGYSYNLSPDSNAHTAAHGGSSSNNAWDYLFMGGYDNATIKGPGSKYGYLPNGNVAPPVLMFTDEIFNKLKESDGKLRARYYKGIANGGTNQVDYFFTNNDSATLNGKTYGFTQERVYLNSPYFKSGSTVNLNDTNYGNLRRLYVVKVASIS